MIKIFKQLFPTSLQNLPLIEFNLYTDLPSILPVLRGWIISTNGSSPKIVATVGDGSSSGVSNYLNTDQNREKISLLRKAYQVLMGIVEVFCLEPSNPDTQLNKFYLNTNKVVWDTIDELRLYVQFSTFKKPFSNLFAAEKECGGKVNWDSIRPEMSAMFGQI